MKRRILITGIGGDIGQGVLKCLMEIGKDTFLVGCDIDEYAASKNAVNVFYKAPKASDEKSYLSFVEGVIKKEGLQYILPTTETEIRLYDLYRNNLEQNGVSLLILRHDIIHSFLDKYETVNFLHRHNLPHPKTFLMADFHGELSFPFLLKSRYGWGAKNIFLINNGDDLEYFGRKIPDAIIQEAVGDIDKEYTVGIFSDGSTIYSIAFRRYLGYGSLTKIAYLVQDEKLSGLAQDIARAVRLEGPLNIQARKTTKGYIPFEVNPRLSSTVYLRNYFGFCDVQWWIALKEGSPIVYTMRYHRGIAVRTIGETFFDLA